jgi:hypothetical protein
MPNTLAHFAINGLFTRAVLADADLKWVYLGCVIPDLPWILQRIVKSLPMSVDLYDLRAYCVAQSSLLLCIFICIAFAMLAKQRRKVFTILSIGALLHLLLDAAQIKWANGVHLLVPFDWSLIRFDLFWPESLGTYVLTAAGVLYFVFNVKKVLQTNCEEFVISRLTISFSAAFLLIWFVLPYALLQSVYSADNHFIATLNDIQHRAGKNIELDRNTYLQGPDGYRVKTPFGEMIQLKNIEGIHAISGSLISLQGKFTDNHSIYVDNYHIHTRFRDYASMIGLVIVLCIWFVFIMRCLVTKFRVNSVGENTQ